MEADLDLKIRKALATELRGLKFRFYCRSACLYLAQFYLKGAGAALKLLDVIECNLPEALR